MRQPIADICVILEGSYPYITGGVSSWMHDLIGAQADLTFHIVTLTADDGPRELKYMLPANVVGLSTIALQETERDIPSGPDVAALIAEIEEPLARLVATGRLADLEAVLATLRRHGETASRAALLNSEPAFDMLQRMYERTVPGSSFLNYFWTWRSLLGGLFSILLAPLPQARVYHTISTGYAGLVLARAVVETGCPGLLTEHGIYTNERRVEITMADWLADGLNDSLDLDNRPRDLRDVWIDAFTAYSHVCYEACRRIVTLYSGNQVMQLRDGADAARLRIIPNGIDYDALSRVARVTSNRPLTVALIGRVVPIKDVKTYIRTCALLARMMADTAPDLRFLLLGPMDEDPEYFRECTAMIGHLGLEKAFTFTGRVKLADHLGSIDVVVLTSISEAQPLVLLEAGAAGIPSVATDVGSCRDLILGRADEDPALGPGGVVVPLANPQATAAAIAGLLRDADLRARCGEAIRKRTEIHYNKRVVDRIYRALYAECLEPDAVEDGGVLHAEAG
jgi:polysaccharide biosynthesis protein PelF